MRAVILLLDVLTWRKKEKKRHKKYTIEIRVLVNLIGTGTRRTLS